MFNKKITLGGLDKRLKEVEKQVDKNWASFEYIMDCFENPVRFETDGVDNMKYNGVPISEIKVGGTD